MSGWTAWRFADPLFFALIPCLTLVVYATLLGRRQEHLRFPSVELAREARGGRHRSFRLVPLALRVAALFCILLALARPQGGSVSREVLSEGVDILLLADTSGSMKAMDFTMGGKRATRLEVAKKVIRDFIAGRVNDRIGLVVFGEEAFVPCPTTVDYGVLDSTLDAVKLKMAGDGTAIGSAIGVAVQSLKELPGRARIVILLTDGKNTTGLLDPLQAARAAATYGIKVYTIGVGDPNAPRNIRIVGPSGPKEALRKEEVAFDITLSSEGLSGRPVTVTLEGSRNNGPYMSLASEPATLGSDGVPVKVRIYHAFEEAGDYSLRFEVSSFPEETSLEDNQDTRFLRVNDEKIRVLYIDDWPRWEYRYVKNALLRVDPSIEVQCFLLDASRTWNQEHSESLSALTSLPRTREELLKYHVILIGDVPPERLGATEERVNEWLELLVEFVEFGGGVGCMSGPRAMPDHYRGTPLEDLLPVVLEDTLQLQKIEIDMSQGFVPQLETPVLPHDIVLLKREPKDNERLWHSGFDKFVFYRPVQQAKAGAEVILRHAQDANRFGKRVIAAASFYPRGRTFFIATDETWRLRNPYGEKYHDPLWRNIVRNLAAGRLQRRNDLIELRLDKAEMETGGQIKVTLEVLDDEFEPSKAREFPVFFRRPDQEPEKYILRSRPGEAGAYRGTRTMDQPGAVSVIVYANDNPSDEVIAREDLLVKLPNREMEQSSQDRGMLEQIAAASKGGRYLFLADAEQLMEDFRDKRPYQNEIDRSTRPVWDTIWTLLAILFLLAVEWIYRKRRRLV